MTDEWVTLSSRVVYETPWMRVREDTLSQPSGRPGVYSYVEKGPFVSVIPFDGERVHLVNQFRYPLGAAIWELPGGRADTDDLCEMAFQELVEETGLIAGRLTSLGSIYLAPGGTNQLGHVFLAEDLRLGEQALESSEEGLFVAAFTIEELDRMLRSADLRDATSLAALALWRLSR